MTALLRTDFIDRTAMRGVHAEHHNDLAAAINLLEGTYAIGSALLRDDFSSGGLATLQIGEIGWALVLTSTGSVIARDGETDHPGIIRLSTGATSGSTAQIGVRGAGTGIFVPAAFFDLTLFARLNTNDASTTIRFGLATTWNSNPDVRGIYMEKLAADTSWFGVCRDASTQTRTAALIACNTSFHKFRIRRVSATQIGFTIDAGTEVLLNTNVPTAALQPFFQIVNTAAADKTADIDYMQLIVPGLAR